MNSYSKIIVNVFSVSLMVLMVSSCDLEIEETDSKILDESLGIFAGVEDPKTSLDNIYNNIRGQVENQANLYALQSVTTDELLVPTRGTDWGDNGVWRTLHAHTWSPTHQYVLAVWNNKNQGILRATEVIDPLSNATDAQVASAKFARAYNMWFIMDFYGQVPFRNPEDDRDEAPEVKTRAEAYDMVVTDLEEAIDDLPVSDPGAADKTRPVKATAQHLLAKVKLNGFIYEGDDSPSTEDMQAVIDLVQDIEDAGYALVGDSDDRDAYFDLFKGTNQANNDVIWTVNASTGNRMWNGLHYNQTSTDNGGGGWNGFTTLAEFYDLFEGPDDTNVIDGDQEQRRGYVHTEESTNATNQGFGYGFQLGQMYGWDADAGEAVALETRGGDPLAFTKELPGLIGNTEETGIRVLKYSPQDGAFASGVVISRFADAYLMRAEAMFRMGNTGDALTEINALRALRGASDLSSLSEEDILAERARELYTEGWRRNDLIRFGQFTKNWEFKASDAVGDETKNLFPIPASALLTNPNLTQNPGY